MYLLSAVSNYFQFVIEKLMSSTKISAENAIILLQAHKKI